MYICSNPYLRSWDMGLHDLFDMFDDVVESFICPFLYDFDLLHNINQCNDSSFEI